MSANSPSPLLPPLRDKMSPIKRRTLIALMERNRPTAAKVMDLLQAICRDRHYMLEYRVGQDGFESLRVAVTIETLQSWLQVEAALLPLSRMITFRQIGVEQKWEDTYEPFGGGNYDRIMWPSRWPRRRRHLGFKYRLEAAFAAH